MQDASSLAEAFEDIRIDFSLDTVIAFCRASWLLPEGEKFYSSTLDRLIYVDGDKNEIYSSEERRIIQAYSSFVFYCPYHLKARTGRIDTRLFALEIEPGCDPIYYSVALMKIINKAYDGFNVFIFASEQGLLLGYAGLGKDRSFQDCNLSVPICDNINWELLSEVFLNRDDSLRFIDFYSGISTTVGAIRYCYWSLEEKVHTWGSFSQDGDYYDRPYTLDFESYADRYYEASNDEVEDAERKFAEFEGEVMFCNEELSFIKKARINPLELLFEAEAALDIADKEEDSSSKPQTNLEDPDVPEMEFIDDPIELMKKLKRMRGGT